MSEFNSDPEVIYRRDNDRPAGAARSDEIIDDLLPRVMSADGPKALAEARQADRVMNKGPESKILDQSQKREQDELARLKTDPIYQDLKAQEKQFFLPETKADYQAKETILKKQVGHLKKNYDQDSSALADCLMDLAKVCLKQNKKDEGAQYQDQAVELTRKAYGPYHERTVGKITKRDEDRLTEDQQYRILLQQSRDLNSGLRDGQGNKVTDGKIDFPAAEKVLKDMIAHLKTNYGEASPALVGNLLALGAIYSQQNKNSEAVNSDLEAIDISKKVYGPMSDTVGYQYAQLAGYERKAGDPQSLENATTHYEQALRILHFRARETVIDGSSEKPVFVPNTKIQKDMAEIMNDEAEVFGRLNRPDRSAQLIKQAADLIKSLPPPSSPSLSGRTLRK